MSLECRIKRAFPLIVFLFLLTTHDARLTTATLAAPQTPEEAAFSKERQEMVAEQIASRGVQEKRVLQAMRAVPRHLFVPEHLAAFAYTDSPLPIGEGQTISQPYIVALMTELADIEEGEKVLEIGTGSGYQAAILAQMTPHVYTIEILPALATRASQTLRDLGYTQVRTRLGDGYLGWPEEDPFDAILVTAAPDHIPQPLIDQLAPGGVLIVPVGPGGGLQQLKRLRKQDEKIFSEEVIPVHFVPLIRKKEGVE